MSRETKITIVLVLISVVFISFWAYIIIKPHSVEPSGIIKTGEERCDFEFKPSFVSWQPSDLVIVKPKGDYADKVMVVLSGDKTEIGGALGIIRDTEEYRPVVLNDGYLLYSRWFGDAYLNVTWERYNDLVEVVGLSDLINYVLDDNPFLEYYDCGMEEAVHELAIKTKKFFYLKWKENKTEEEFQKILTYWRNENLDERFINLFSDLWYENITSEEFGELWEDYKKGLLKERLNLIIECGKLDACR